MDLAVFPALLMNLAVFSSVIDDLVVFPVFSMDLAGYTKGFIKLKSVIIVLIAQYSQKKIHLHIKSNTQFDSNDSMPLHQIQIK